MMARRYRTRPILASLAVAALLLPPAAAATGAGVALTGPWGVVGWLAADGAGGGSSARSAAYREGQQALDAEN